MAIGAKSCLGGKILSKPKDFYFLVQQAPLRGTFSENKDFGGLSL